MLSKRRRMVVVFFLMLSGLLSAALQFRDGRLPRTPNLPWNLPLEAPGWRGIPNATLMPKEVEPGDYILRTYISADGNELDVMAFYSRISDYHHPAICYRGAGQQLTDIPALSSSSGKIRLAGMLGKRDSNSMLVYHGFFINGRVIPDGIERKLYEMKEKLTRGRIDQYFFEIKMNINDHDHSRAISFIKKYLDDMEKFLIPPGISKRNPHT